MTVDKISYSESKESVNEIGLKSWRKAGVEIELDSDGYDDVKQAFGEAKRIVGDALPQADFPYEYSGLPMPHSEIKWDAKTSTITLPTIDYSAKEKVEKAIEDCKTPHELDLLMGDIAKHGLVKEFLNKKNKLQNG